MDDKISDRIDRIESEFSKKIHDVINRIYHMQSVCLSKSKNCGCSSIHFELLLVGLIQGISIYFRNHFLGSFSEITLCTWSKSLRKNEQGLMIPDGKRQSFFFMKFSCGFNNLVAVRSSVKQIPCEDEMGIIREGVDKLFENSGPMDIAHKHDLFLAAI